MLPLATINLVDLWEQAHPLAPLGRARALVAAACPGEAVDALPMGTCHAWMLALYVHLRGAAMPCAARCPACAERLEFSLSATDLLQRQRVPEPVAVTREGRTYVFRAPTLADLVAVPAGVGADAHLAARCLVEPSGVALPGEVVAEAERLLAEEDPLALVTLDLLCPVCETAWHEPLNVGEVVAHALEQEACGFLYDVHRLAQAYGWTEADVAALSPWRRRQYLAWAEA